MRSTLVLSFQTKSLSKIWICAKDKGKPWASAENVGGLALIQALQMASNAPILHISNPVPCQNILNIRWFKIHVDDKNVGRAKQNVTFTFTGHLLTFFNNLPNLHSSSLTNICILRCNWVWSMFTLTHVSVCFPVLITLNYSLKKDIKW